MKVVMIAAVSWNGVIGREGKIPWHIPEDFARFRDRTMGKPLVMGRKTFEAIVKRIKKSLPGRYSIVVTRSLCDLSVDGVSPQETCESPKEALARAKEVAVIMGVPELMVIGGESVYEALLGEADELDFTVIEENVRGDAYIPDINWDEWREIWQERHVSEKGVPFRFVRFARLKHYEP